MPQLNDSEDQVCLIISSHSYACIVKMSLVSYNLTDQFVEDVLLVIFDHLDEEDLLRCETVCSQWRNILLSGRPWKGLFHRKIVSSPQWRQVWWDLGVDEKKLETVHNRELCKTITKEVNEIANNWRNGKFKINKINEEPCYAINFADLVIGKSWIADFIYDDWDCDGEKTITFRNRTNLDQHCIVIPAGSLAVTNAEIVVAWDKKNIKILDTNGQLISEVLELDEDERISWNLASCCISGDQMAVLSQTDGQEKLSLWNVKDPSKVRRLMSEHFNRDLQFDLKSSMKMDDQFIAISTFHNETTRFYFFSKKTLNLLWQKTLNGNMKDDVVYGQGMLLLYEKKSESEEFGIIEMYDVTHQTQSHLKKGQKKASCP